MPGLLSEGFFLVYDISNDFFGSLFCCGLGEFGFVSAFFYFYFLFSNENGCTLVSPSELRHSGPSLTRPI